MVSLFVVYAFVLLATAVFVAAVGGYAWERRDRTGATPLAVLLAGQSVWCVCAFAAIATRGTRWALLWSRLWYVGIVIVVAGLFVFALAYTGNDQYLGRWTYGALAVEPVVLIGVVAFDPTPLLYTVLGPSETAMIGWEVVSGRLFWAHAAYSYALVGVASTLIIRSALSSDSMRQKQVVGLVFGIFAPWIGNGLYLFGDLGFDPTPLAFSVTAIALAWTALRTDFLDISPVAHREVIESLNSAVFVVGTDDRVIEVNDSGRALLGESVTVGDDIRTVLDQWPAVREQYESIVDSVERREMTMEHNDRYFTVESSPLYDDRGDPLGRVFLVHEITEQKARQRELERRNRQLDQFASVVSHDLRNPLNVASGSLALAEQTGDPEHFERVERAHDRMQRLVDEVLALARDETTLEADSLSLSELAESAWEHVDTGDANLVVERDRPLVGDRDQLLRLFENLFRNSVEHGGPAVTVTVIGTDDGFAVEDDGPGVPADERDEVFDHGFSTSSSGTGLGLAIVDHVAASHGWTVRATESPAGGFRVAVTELDGALVTTPSR
ncbi:PAS domain-containing protein [Halomicroarcula sp. F13]|uniref:histidine kinase n=1 Tax=Haloarcula rubra TaxID=2487747 RepID=A0AAW4PT47_9EURY|nr:histidine kinase N-terminal 7TM domain-containing protein [Halomicroarcula rubra]MBX0323339.1 PAS domain-containing protein [Halomicroarcula rubra]